MEETTQAKAARKAFLAQPSSAASERVFSLFGERQTLPYKTISRNLSVIDHILSAFLRIIGNSLLSNGVEIGE